MLNFNNWMANSEGQVCVLRCLFPHFDLSQAKCLTSPTWLKSLVLTRQSSRRRRLKKRTLCPPKRVSALRLWRYPMSNNFDAALWHAACRAANRPMTAACFHSISFLLPHAAIEQERKGDATPWLLITWCKEDATAKKEKKALSFDYYSVRVSYFVFKLGCWPAP